MTEAIFPVVFPGPPGKPPDGPDELAAAAHQSLALLSVLPGRVGAVLAGIAYRAAAGAPYADGAAPSVVLAGLPGCGKTTCGTAALSHFSPETRTRSGWRDVGRESSPGGPRRRLVMVDVPALDHSVLMTGDGGQGGPEAMEALTVSLALGEVTADRRAALVALEARQGRAALGASFSAWLAGKDQDRLAARKTSLAARFAGEWRDEGHSPRAARMLAEMSAGWALMLGHLEHAGACLPPESRQLWQQARAGLHEAGLADAALAAGGVR